MSYVYETCTVGVTHDKPGIFNDFILVHVYVQFGRLGLGHMHIFIYLFCLVNTHRMYY